jgi:hypothetical protein
VPVAAREVTAEGQHEAQGLLGHRGRVFVRGGQAEPSGAHGRHVEPVNARDPRLHEAAAARRRRHGR